VETHQGIIPHSWGTGGLYIYTRCSLVLRVVALAICAALNLLSMVNGRENGKKTNVEGL